MSFTKDELDEMKGTFAGVQMATESNVVYFLMPQLILPSGVSPAKVDALLCPRAQCHGYPSRLFFSEKLTLPVKRNWNANNVHILGRNWWAFSWSLQSANLRPAQIAALHLKALT